MGKKEQPYQSHGEITRIVSLNNGYWAYLSDDKGKLHHLRRYSNEFAELCFEVDKILGGKLRTELKDLGWTDVLDKIHEIEDNGGIDNGA